MKRISSLLYVTLPLLLFAWSCDGPLSSRNESDGVQPVVSAKGGGQGGGEAVEVVGNNLSFPVIWADGVTKALRGTSEPLLAGESFVKNDTTWYVQADPLNTWQADNVIPVNRPVTVSFVDWGDNLEAKSWPYGSQVRVETVLYKLLEGPPMKAYRMMIYDESITGVDEIWGTSGTSYLNHEATIYSGTARLVIQKLTKVRDSEDLSLEWDATNSRWIGDANEPVVSSGVWTNLGGPTAYSAEINVQGKLLYGYNWVTKRDGEGAGDYRITFVLEPNVPGVTCNTLLDRSTVVMVPEEETVTAEEEDGGSESTGGAAVIDTDNNLTYIDVRLTDGTGGKGGGQGGGKGKSGGGGSGSGGGGHGR